MQSTLFSNKNQMSLGQSRDFFKKGINGKQKPSDLIKQQTNGTISTEESQKKPKIICQQNLGDHSANTSSKVNIDEPLFEPIPNLICFNDYEPLQIKEQRFRLRNKDKFARRVKIIQPESRLFQVIPFNSANLYQKVNKSCNTELFAGNKVAPGMEIQFIIRFSPEAKIDYNYDLIVETEREKFIVPIKAIGKRAMIDFPDSLDFGNVPVKYMTEKPVIIRNLGDKTSKWNLKLPQGFDANKKEGVLEYGKNDQIVIQFYPIEARNYVNEAVLYYDNLEAYISIKGTAQNGNVYLSKQNIYMDESYIGLYTQQTLQIVNKSDVRVDFQWRAFKTEKEEQDKKNKLKIQLEQEEAEEKMLLKEIVSNEIIKEDVDLDDQDESDEEEKDEKIQIIKRQKKAELLLSMKYKNISKAIEDEMLLFQDDIFSIEPLKGRIWPQSEMTITITFKPKLALQYNCTSFLNISYSEQRLALPLMGEGQGPKAVLSANDINIGDIYVGEEKKELLMIENKGEIKAIFKLIKSDTPFGKMFDFDIEEGVLDIGKRIGIQWSFRSTILGEFSETFKWKLEGSTDMLTIIFTGHVMAPKFQFVPNSLDFGRSSYSFAKPKTIKLENRSNVPFKFSLRIPGDGKLSKKEFEIKPSQDIIQAKQSMNIEVIFIPQVPKIYDMVMVIDLDGIGQDMFSLPIKGVCEVPNVRIEPSYELAFGQIFLRNPDFTQIHFINMSNLQAKYQCIPQQEETKILAEYQIDKSSGVIEPNQKLTLNMQLITKKLGEISLPLAFNIEGHSQNNPHILMITANSTGPIVEVSQKEIDFDLVQVLENKSMFVKIKNKSTIIAEFHCFTKKKPSHFKVVQKHGKLNPDEELNVEVICCADEANKLNDILHFVIKEGKDFDVALKARSSGHTIFWKENLDSINFGTLYTHRSKIINVLIENKGNQSQLLQWSKREEKKNKGDEEKKNNNKKGQAQEEEEEQMFEIIPDKIELPARSGYIFQFKAFSEAKGKQVQKYNLLTTIPKDRKQSILTTATLEAQFVSPSLVFSESKLHFYYQHHISTPIMPVSKTFFITNNLSLPANFSLKVDMPFTINNDLLSLLPSQSQSVTLDFDPNFRLDRISAIQKHKLTVTHQDHPHKEYIELLAELQFPNLTFQSQNINFGAILIETQKKIVQIMKNDSKMKLDYEWSFLDQEIDSDNTKHQINEIFDILPLSGSLEPGESEEVEFIYYALNGKKHKTTAVCHVAGGPEYQIILQGDSSNQEFKLSTQTIEVGEVKYNEFVQKDFYLENTGKVTFEYKVILSSIIRKGLVEVSPLEGKIAGQEKQKFILKFCPGFPDIINEKIFLQCGYYEPQTIFINGKGIFPSIVTNLSRENNEQFQKYFNREKNSRAANEQKMIEAYFNRMGQTFNESQLNIQSAANTKNSINSLINAENLVQEIEQECDRKSLCQMIISQIKSRADQNDQQNHHQKFFDDIILSHYFLDFGNVIINSNPKKKVFKITNTGNLVCDVIFDMKQFKNSGYTIVPEKILKMAKGQSNNITVTFSTKNRKNIPGKNRTIIPIEIKHGPKYELELVNNITFPEIFVEKEDIDFGKVLVNQRKTIYMRFYNKKEIDCVWEVRKQAIGSVGQKDENRFDIYPLKGVLGSGQKITVELSFIPTSDKMYNNKFQIVIQENSKPLIINVKGQGQQIQLQYSPDNLQIGPVLPYNNEAYALVEITNPSDYDTELFSLDFDQQFLKEEKHLAKYEEFKNNAAVYLPIRNPGSPFWQQIIDHNQNQDLIQSVTQNIKDLQNQLASLEDQSQIHNINLQIKNFEEQLLDLESVTAFQENISKVDSDLLHNIIVFGPRKCGKSKVARNLAKTHRRNLINFNEILEWNLNKNTQESVQAQEYLNTLLVELQTVKEERDKIIKKAGKKAQQFEDIMGPLNEKLYKYLSEPIIESLLRRRLQEKDCNAGVIFDNLEANFCPNQIISLKLILNVLKSNVQLLVFNHEQQIQNQDQNQNDNIIAETQQLQYEFSSEQVKQQYIQLLSNLKDIMNGSNQKIDFEELIISKPKPFENPEEKLVQQQAKEKQKKVDEEELKRQQQIEEEKKINQQKERESIIKSSFIEGKRIISEVNYNIYSEMISAALKLVPFPIFPDPSTLPLPEPIFQQVVVKPTERKNKVPVKNHEILTPKQMLKPIQQKITTNLSTIQNQILSQSSIQNTEQTKQDLEIKNESMIDFPNLDNKNEQNQQQDKKEEFQFVDLQQGISRWVIPAKRTLQIVIKFISQKIGVYNEQLEFENFNGLKKFTFKVQSQSDFPNLVKVPKDIFGNVIKNRPLTIPESYLVKKFISSENLFDFGPLLINKQAANMHEKKVMQSNSELFKLINNGNFECELELGFSSSVYDPNAEEPKSQVFKVEPQNLNIKSGETQTIRVWALPDQVQQFKDELIVMIKNNPLPLILPLQCLGQRPVIQIIKGDGLQFERLLINQQATQQIVLKNVSAIPLKWSLLGLQDLPSEFTINNVQGDLYPNKETIVDVTFKAIQQQKFINKIQLKVQDVENQDIKQEIKEISIEAEAFNISVAFKFQENSNIVNNSNQQKDNKNQSNEFANQNQLLFGSVRVGEIKEQQFTVKNNGLYKIKFNFKMTKKIYRECFSIEPNESELESGMEKIIFVRFLSKNQELKLKTTSNTTDIIMEILEGKTLELFKPVPINLQVNSVYSKYQINPLKKINFGPKLFNEQKIRHFEIKNDGIFEFNYNIFDYLNEEARQQILEQNKLEMEQLQQLNPQANNNNVKGKDKGGAVKKEEKKDNKKDGGNNKNQLKVGQYLISPYSGSLAADQSQQIEIVFVGSGQQIYEQKIGIDISCRDPKDEPDGIVYEMVGESCIPGIQTENYQSIFEEQVVVSSLQSAVNVVQLVDSNIFAVEEKIFFFKTLVPSSVPEGITEKIKIINGNKVGCTVNLDVRKRNNNQMEQFAFEIEPKSVKIGAHEHTYVKILFKPTIMATYAGMFEAIVDQGEQNHKTHKLTFDLRGEGVLPTLKLEHPKEYLDERTSLLKFNKLRMGKQLIQNIILKNDGQVAATVKFDNTYHSAFSFLSDISYTITPKSYHQFQIQFSPDKQGQHIHNISFQTLLNPYENFKLQLQGESFYEDVSFESLPLSREDELFFGDCIVQIPKKILFQIKNNSQHQIKFNWNLQQLESTLSISPKVGHLSPQQVKTITAQFLSDKPIIINNQPILLETKQIQQNNNMYVDWDDAITIIRYITKSEFQWIQKKKEEEEERKKHEEAQKQQQKGKTAVPVQNIKQQEKYVAQNNNEVADIPHKEIVIEPQYQQLQQQDKLMKLQVNGTCDLVKYECEVKQITFKATMMFTTRQYQFKVKNISNVEMSYNNKLVESLEDQLWNPGYYSISPKQGQIKAGCDELFTVKFSPTEVDDQNLRYLIIQIENLHKDYQPLKIIIDAEALRPVCHFELPPSNIKSERENVRIFEFESLGCKVKNTKRFYIVNPTATGYEFEWRKKEEEEIQIVNKNSKNNNSDSYFRCLTQKGTILSGKKYEVIFEYTPEITGNHLVYYNFYIPEFKLEQQFMICGRVIEPRVFLSLGKINFGPLLLGGKNKEVVILKNLEDVPISFSFNKDSVKGEAEYGESLKVNPISGVVRPESEIAIDILFQPQSEQEYNYNLSCNVQRKSIPINLNVKGIGYILNHQVLSEEQKPLSSHDLTLINFDDIYVNEKRVRKIFIRNNGQFNFDFLIKKSSYTNLIIVKPENGTVRKQELVEIQLTFAPKNEHKFKSKVSKLQLQIVSGPIYHFDIKGSARKPNVEMSFYQYDFGPQFFLKRPLPVQTILEIRNYDKNSMSFECNFEKTNYLDVQLSNGQVLLPFDQNNKENVMKVPIIFTPREIEKYNETVTLNINGLHTVDIQIQGEGVPFKIDLEKQEDQIIDFGILKMAQDVTKIVNIVNHSKKAINISFDLDNQLSQLQESYLSVIPNKKEIKIMPREKHEIEIRFNPQNRLHKFTKELYYQIVENSETRKLLNIEGGCHGIELKLMEDTLGFGPVVLNSKLVKQLQLANLGDIGVHFNWDNSFYKQFFTIYPKQGYISANEDVYFEVTFHPNVIDNDIRFNKVKCQIDGGQCLYINLLGKCVAMPVEQIQQIQFQAEVRQIVKQKISLKNTSSQNWKIKAVISSSNSNHNYFSGLEIVEVNANSTIEYEVSYNPQTMTSNNQTHNGQIFFPLPDGQAIISDLIGKSLPPQPKVLESKQFKAKENNFYIIPVQNWLKQPQRFDVHFKLDKEEETIFINGANTIDIMANQLKDYKLTLYSLKSTNNYLQVTFKNPITQEFVQFKINLIFNPTDILNTFELSSQVRESTSQLITIENPLNQLVQIKPEYFFTDNDSITFNPNNFKILPKSEFGFEVNYRPLISGNFQSKFTLKSPELGDFIYQLQLKGIPNQNQKQLTFKTTLATEIIQTFKFINYLKKQVQYQIKIEKIGNQLQKQTQGKDQKVVGNDFSLENQGIQQIMASASDNYDGIEVPINIRFEPSSLLESKALLTVSNNEGGEYQCLLIGYGLSPQPKGPFKIAGAKPPPIDFKNPFFESMDFIIRIDNPSFTSSLKSPIKIEAKKTVSIVITYKPVTGTTNNGRLTISTEDMPPWVFYLQGE